MIPEFIWERFARKTIGRYAAVPLSVTLVAAADLRPQFDVASVRPNNSGTGVDRIRNLSGTFEIINVSLKRLVAMAWGIPDSREYLIRGPEWIDEKNFDIEARYPAATARADTLLMLQRLLEERFHMVLKHETREVSGYALVVAKSGSKPTPRTRTTARSRRWLRRSRNNSDCNWRRAKSRSTCW